MIEHDKNLNSLEKRNSLLEIDVKRFREREVHLKKVSILSAVLPGRKFEISKGLYNEAKQIVKDSIEKSKKLEKRNKPLTDKKTSLTREKNKFDLLVKELRQDYNGIIYISY